MRPLQNTWDVTGCFVTKIVAPSHEAVLPIYSVHGRFVVTGATTNAKGAETVLLVEGTWGVLCTGPELAGSIPFDLTLPHIVISQHCFHNNMSDNTKQHIHDTVHNLLFVQRLELVATQIHKHAYYTDATTFNSLG